MMEPSAALKESEPNLFEAAKRDWRPGMPSRAPARPWISSISRVERRRSTRPVRSSGVHPRFLETTGRVFFGLEPDVPLAML
jgi:hypothetical protein